MVFFSCHISIDKFSIIVYNKLNKIILSGLIEGGLG